MVIGARDAKANLESDPDYTGVGKGHLSVGSVYLFSILEPLWISTFIITPLTAPMMAEEAEQEENVITVTADYRESSKDDTTASMCFKLWRSWAGRWQHLEEVINLIPNLTGLAVVLVQSLICGIGS